MTEENSKITKSYETPLNTEPAYWSEGQVANRLGLSVQWLRQERARGKSIPYRKFGRSIKYKIADVLDYEEKALVSFTGQSQPIQGRRGGC